jgi:hypothetical protein
LKEKKMTITAMMMAIAITLHPLRRREQILTMTTVTMMIPTMAVAMASHPTIRKMITISMGEGNVVQQHLDCTIQMTTSCLMTFSMMITWTSIFRRFPMSPLVNVIVIELWEGPPPGPNATLEEREAYENKRKAFTDANHRKLLSSLKSVGLDVSPQKVSSDDRTGDQYPHIRLMTLVESGPLLEGHTFAKKETVMIRIGKEANLRNIKVKVL